MNPVIWYTRWLHTRWPAGTVEKLPVVNADGSTNVPGFYVVGDLTGVPLLKFSADTGARAVETIAGDAGFKKRSTADPAVRDLAIIGGGVSGFAAALEAERRGLSFEVFEAAEPFSTIVNFPKGKPIYTYPTDMTPSGQMQFHEKADVKEGLLEDLHEQTLEAGIEPTRARVQRVRKYGGVFEVDVADGDNVRAHRVVVGIGRSGNFRELDVPGEDSDKVYNRLHDPQDFCGQDILVVGGGDSAMETAIALANCGSRVTLSYRGRSFNRPKSENVEKLKRLAENPGSIVDVESPTGDRVSTASGQFIGQPRESGSVRLLMGSHVREIEPDAAVIEDAAGQRHRIDNDSVFTMIGREAPLDFFRQSGVKISGERTWGWWLSFAAFFLLCFWVYHWKGGYAVFAVEGWNLPSWLQPDPGAMIKGWQQRLGAWASSPQNPLGVLLNSMQSRAFYYTLLYSALVVVFGVRRIRRRRTPYVKVQTLTLMAIQVVPLFVLPEILLPWIDGLGGFDGRVGGWIEATFFPGGSWWRAYGLILAWPLMAWNWFTAEPIWGWLILGFVQTFVLIPAMIFFWGKGSYCGWICSCGAMAETLGDTHRHKMPHGRVWNRLNMIGQVFLLFAFGLMGLKIAAWSGVGWAEAGFTYAAKELPVVNYAWLVDLFFAGAIGYGFYFWFSGRVWCRFACPLAALMHIYTRAFSRFAILAEKQKCISCNVCTSVCHQGIDVMSFANKGLPMQDPECVRCSACVQSCPTGVLSFGQVDAEHRPIARDPSWLAASPVRLAELTVNGKRQNDDAQNATQGRK